jgi:outer membrane protein assembly factor BamB
VPAGHLQPRENPLRLSQNGEYYGIAQPMKRFIAPGILVVALSASGSLAPAADWSHWRGPSFTGATSETNLPAHWTKTENVAWSADLPGPGAATPVVLGDHVFVSSTDLREKSLVAVAFDRVHGRQLWRNKIGDGIGRDEKSNYAAPSPTTDGERVFFFYGNGELVAFDVSGRRVWGHNLQAEYGDFAFQWTFSASPTLYGGRLYVQVLQRDVPVNGRGRSSGGPIESFILALDPASGKTLWRQVRASDAVAESRESYATPIPFVNGDRTEILIAGGDCLTGHDPATGRELWRWGTWNPRKIGHWRLVPSPVGGEGIVLACAPKRDPVYAIKAGGEGVLGDTALAWKSPPGSEISSDVPTPLFYQGDFFVLSDVRKALSRVEPGTGRVKWTTPTPGQSKYEASPTGADGRIYLMNFRGQVTVVKADDGTLLQTVDMGEEGDDATRSSIAVARGSLFIRTNHKLFCVRSPR